MYFIVELLKGHLKVFEWRYGEFLRYPACWETSHWPADFIIDQANHVYRLDHSSLSHVVLHTGYNFWEELILRFLKTPPFKNLKLDPSCCGQLWVRHMICGQTCDGLYHFTFYLIGLGYPLDSNRSSQP